MIRVFVVQESCATGSRLNAALADAPGICVVGQATTPATALALLSEQPCDIVSVSSTLPANGAFHFMRTLRDQCAPVKVLVTDLTPDSATILHCLEEGAAGYSEAQESIQSLVDKLHALAADEFPLPPPIAAGLMARVAALKRRADEQCVYTKKRPTNSWASLSAREREVLQLLARGLDNPSIAAALCIEAGTVKNHVHKILRKLDVPCREEAAVIAKQFLESKAR